MSITRWSNSMLYTFQQCGEKGRRRYIERDNRPSGVRAKRGSAVHKVSAQAHLRQLAAKEAGKPREEYLVAALPSVEEARDVAATEFDAAMQYGCAFTDDEKAVGVEKVAGEQKDAAVAMAGHYVKVDAPRVDPVAVERRVLIQPPGMDVQIVGITDLVSEENVVITPPDAERQMRGRIEIINDLKTADRQPQEDAAAKSQQLPLYALIRMAETGKMPDKVRLRTMVRTRTGKTSTVEQTADVAKENLEAVAQRLNVAIEMVRRGVFMPANPDSWWCSQKYCEYFNDCVFAMGRERKSDPA